MFVFAWNEDKTCALRYLFYVLTVERALRCCLLETLFRKVQIHQFQNASQKGFARQTALWIVDWLVPALYEMALVRMYNRPGRNQLVLIGSRMVNNRLLGEIAVVWCGSAMLWRARSFTVWEYRFWKLHYSVFYPPDWNGLGAPHRMRLWWLVRSSSKCSDHDNSGIDPVRLRACSEEVIILSF